MDSPSPVPPYLRVDDPSACVNASNIAFWRSSGIPMPLSVTVNCRFTQFGALTLLC